MRGKPAVTRIPLLAEEGWPRQKRNVAKPPCWSGRGGQIGVIYKFPQRVRPQPLRRGECRSIPLPSQLHRPPRQFSKNEFQPKLHLAGRFGRIKDAAEIRAESDMSRNVEVRRVEDIEHFPYQLDALFF